MILEELDDRWTKSRPKLTKLHRHDHKGLVNMSTEEIYELLHGFGGIVEIRSKIGVFSRMQKLRFVVTRDSEGFSTTLEGFKSLQRVTNSSSLELNPPGITSYHESEFLHS